VDSGQWTVDSGQWTVDSGQWAVDSGQWKGAFGDESAEMRPERTAANGIGDCRGKPLKCRRHKAICRPRILPRIAHPRSRCTRPAACGEPIRHPRRLTRAVSSRMPPSSLRARHLDRSIARPLDCLHCLHCLDCTDCIDRRSASTRCGPICTWTKSSPNSSPGPAESGQATSGQARSGQVRPGQARSGRVTGRGGAGRGNGDSPKRGQWGVPQKPVGSAPIGCGTRSNGCHRILQVAHARVGCIRPSNSLASRELRADRTSGRVDEWTSGRVDEHPREYCHSPAWVDGWVDGWIGG
jgi:hypothetical protein